MSLDRIETKIDRLDERLDRVDLHLERYNNQLEIHIKRSDALEAAVQPVIQLTAFTKTGFKILSWVAASLAAVAAIVAAIAKLLG